MPVPLMVSDAIVSQLFITISIYARCLKEKRKKYNGKDAGIRDCSSGS
jgi:hypothetical protein